MSLGWSAVTSAIELLDAVRADLRQARSGAATCRTYDVLADHEPQGVLIEVLGGTSVVFWRSHSHTEVFGELDVFAEAHPDLLLVLKDHGTAVALHDRLRRGLRPRNDSGEVQGVLSDRDLRTIRLVSQGRSNKEIGRALGIAASTAKNRLTVIFHKLGVSDRLQLGLKAQDMNLPPSYGAEDQAA